MSNSVDRVRGKVEEQTGQQRIQRRALLYVGIVLRYHAQQSLDMHDRGVFQVDVHHRIVSSEERRMLRIHSKENGLEIKRDVFCVHGKCPGKRVM